MNLKRFGVSLLLFVTAVLAARGAEAFPTFARKYETGCVTCHVAIPKLNSFGVIFRNNGFEWPGGDEDMVKDKPIVVSAEANREGFPDTLWPSWIPRFMPISLLAASELDMSPNNKHWIDATGLGSDIEFQLGGAIAKGFAVRADLVLLADPLQMNVQFYIEQAWAQVNLWDRHLNFRFGKLWPELFDFVQQSLVNDYWLYVRSLGDTPWTLAFKYGGELRGIGLHGRFRYVVGTAVGAGTTGSLWDVWGRAGFKIGGMRYDGGDDGHEDKANGVKASQPFVDDSVQIGAFAYYGHSQYCVDSAFNVSPVTRDAFSQLPVPCAAQGDATNSAVVDEFLHVGGSTNIWWGSANLVGAAMAAHHSHLWANPALGGPTGWFPIAMAQLDYVVFPWLVPSLRFEYSGDVANRQVAVTPGTAPPMIPINQLWHAQAGSSFLVRANFRLYSYLSIGPTHTSSVGFSNLAVGALASF